MTFDLQFIIIIHNHDINNSNKKNNDNEINVGIFYRYGFQYNVLGKLLVNFWNLDLFVGSKSPIPLLVQESGLNIVLHSASAKVPEVNKSFKEYLL